MGDARIQRCLEAGVSVIAGSVDTLGNPSCCRGVGLKSSDDLATVTVYLPVATSQETIANVAANGRLAIVTAHPVDHCATQLKGVVWSTRLAREDEEPFVRGHLSGFGGVLNKIGYPPRLTKAIRHWPAFALEMRVEQIYEQTPGPRAGTRLR